MTTQRLIWKWIALAGLMLLSACAEPRLGKNLVIVLPDADGSVGAVTVSDGTKSVVLDKALAAARISTADKVEAITVTDKDVEDVFAKAIAALPIPPKRFRLYFIEGSDELTRESVGAFEEVFTDIKRRGAYEIEVTGHTDRKGRSSDNARLSIKRALAIRDKLAARGIDATLIAVYGRGEWDLYIKTEDGKDEPLNRRVEIVVR